MAATAVAAFLLLLLVPFAAAHNITAILAAFPEYSLYNSYLTQTRVCDEINDRSTLTTLVLDNPTMTSLASGLPLAAIKNALRLLTVLDYFDAAKLHSLSDGSILASTLLQAAGHAPSNFGFVNITDLRGGRVGFASTAPGSKFDSTFTKAVKQIPYNISVLEVSAPVVFKGLFDVPTGANLTDVLSNNGCKTFAKLLETSGVIKLYETNMKSGLTVLAPSDAAFESDATPDVASLSSAELVTLLQYHALPSYSPKTTLKAAAGAGPVATLASSVAGKYDVAVVAHGDDVALDSGVVSSRVADTVLDDAPLCVHVMDSVLLPVELFGAAPGSAPAPSPAGAAPVEAPAPAAEAPKAKKGKKKHKSPPAPPSGSTPAAAPAGAPAAAAADKVDVKSSAVKVKVVGLGLGFVVGFLVLVVS